MPVPLESCALIRYSRANILPTYRSQLLIREAVLCNYPTLQPRCDNLSPASRTKPCMMPNLPDISSVSFLKKMAWVPKNLPMVILSKILPFIAEAKS